MATTGRVLNIDELFEQDNSIEYDEYIAQDTNNSSSLNSITSLRITINKNGEFYLPHKAYLEFEGRLTKADGSAYANADNVALVNNAMLYLFTDIAYSIGGVEVERINKAGIATTMMGMLKYSNNFTSSQGLNQCWYKDTGPTASIANNTGFGLRQAYIIQSPTEKGDFAFAVPLDLIFGFCEDYNKVVFNYQHELTFTRATDDNAIFRDAAAGAGKVTLSRMRLLMPKITPDIAAKTKLYDAAAADMPIEVMYRKRMVQDVTVTPGTTSYSWNLNYGNAGSQVQYLVFGFQTDKSNDQTKNPAIFDNLNLINLQASINGSPMFPVTPYDCNFPNQRYSRLYRETATFPQYYYGLNEMISQTNINPTDFKTLFPIFIIDMSKHPPAFADGTPNIAVTFTFRSAVPANTQAYCVSINMTEMEFNASGMTPKSVNKPIDRRM